MDTRQEDAISHTIDFENCDFAYRTGLAQTYM